MNAVASASRLDRATDALERIAKLARACCEGDMLKPETTRLIFDDMAQFAQMRVDECKGSNNG